MHLLYIIFGKNTALHAQGAFSIYSFLTQKKLVTTITVMTDAPEYYLHLKEEVVIIHLDDAILKEWQGPHLFFWRIKIKAIESLCRQYKGDAVMYVDTDTFLYGDGQALVNELQKGTALMHQEEGPLSKGHSKTEKLMWQQAKGGSFGGMSITETSGMWNAGIVAIPNTNGGKECELALAICDDMCAAGITKRLIEQFALSLSLAQFYGLQAAGGIVAHYWSNKEEWNKEIYAFFAESFFKQHTSVQIIGLMKEFDFSLYPVKKITKNTANRLHKKTDQLFKPKEIVYIKK